MSACNDWQVENWVKKDDRLFGSVHVNAWDPEGAAREIERMAEHPRIVQVMLYIGDQPFGAPRYHPIFEAAVRHRPGRRPTATAGTRRPRSAAAATSSSGTRWCRRSSCRRP